MPNLVSSILSYCELGNREKPALVFLHGFLANHQDWFRVVDAFIDDYHCILLDLPRHGGSANIVCEDFASMLQILTNTINQAVRNKPFYLVGYSLGGRIALNYSANAQHANFRGCIIESSHLGLAAKQRAARLLHDEHWAKRLQNESLAALLFDWYRQGVFASLTQSQRQALIAKRMGSFTDVNEKSYRNGLAQMLMATSLGKQPHFSSKDFPLPMLYLCGELDTKFTQMAQLSGLVYSKVEKAGHNVHVEQPKAYSKLLTKWLFTLNEVK